jgi:hypothetical protein
VLEPMNRRVYDGCCGSGGMVRAGRAVRRSRRRPAPSCCPHRAQAITSIPAAPRLRRAGLVHSSKTGTTVTYTLSHPLVVDLLTVIRSRLHEVINDRIEHWPNRKPTSPTSECP